VHAGRGRERKGSQGEPESQRDLVGEIIDKRMGASVDEDWVE
jgi:hypothetical protein